MSADYAEMRKRAERWVRACEMVKDPSSAVHARDVLRLLEERDALRAWAEQRATEARQMLATVRGCDQAARSAWDEVVDRIDGKNG